MKAIKRFLGVIFLSTLISTAFAQAPDTDALSKKVTSFALAQAAGAGADYNKADRERVQKAAEEQRKRAECMQTCDTIFRGQYAACGGYPLTAQATCALNIDKNKAQCYQACK